MINEDFHVHTSFSDGKNTPEEVIEAALRKGMTRLGFSDHGYAAYDLDCCMPEDRQQAYRETIAALKERYRGRIELFCGIEQDLWSDTATGGYDYVIGSTHYVDPEWGSVDNTPELLLAAAEQHFGGDLYALAEEYYRIEAQVVERTNCDIIGHFDLVSKFIEKQPLFDPTRPRYVAAWRGAADALLRTGVPFEINTGAMSRGWRTTPYPAPEIMAYLRDHGARFVLSSDSHAAETLCFDFAAQEKNALKMGLDLVSFTPKV